MKILKVIHGYPLRYNAGSEVYSQTLCHGLAKNHQVHVFTREEDSFAPDYRLRIEHDASDPRITLYVINNPRNKDRYQVAEIDARFREVLELIHPDVVHIGHLNHLSTSLLSEAASREIPIIYTLHDYWLMCPRGQFMQMFANDANDLWAACNAQEDRKCAERCYARYFSGAENEYKEDVAYWTHWVARRMDHIREISKWVDIFIAPAHYLLNRYQRDFGLPIEKLRYLDYGFATSRLTGRKRSSNEIFTFGYIGTHIPAKGIHDLIRAFGLTSGNARLRIWGRPTGQDTNALKMIASELPDSFSTRIEWMPEYRNQDIVSDVFNHVDVIVVPSIWVENSPLVIHEAQQVRIPVITADAGGMREYVQHDVNGLLFEHRSYQSLATQMQRCIDDPTFAAQLGARGYLLSTTGDIPAIENHVVDIEAIYIASLHRRNSTRIHPKKVPWRITFDTNPDTCNLHCVMCEEHSPYSDRQRQRKQNHLPHRQMPFDLIERVVTELADRGLREIIPSTMGEPLLYQHFEKIIHLCVRHNLKLNLTTNGTFPGCGAKKWAEKIVPVASDVKISWNGATKTTQEQVMLGTHWEALLNNVREFIAVRDEIANTSAHRCRVTFQLTFMEQNTKELAEIVRLAISLGVDRVKGHHLWTHFNEIQSFSMRRSPLSIAQWNQAVLDAQCVANENFLPNGQHILLENFTLLNETASADISPEGQCPFLGKEAWISTEGRFNPCCAPDEKRQTLGEFGNLNLKGLTEIWHSSAYQNLIATYRNHPLCKGCNMKKHASESI